MVLDSCPRCYVKISGMIDESMDKKYALPPQFSNSLPSSAFDYHARRCYGQLYLGFIIYIGMAFAYAILMWRIMILKTWNVIWKSPCKSGFQNGDKILAADGTPIVKFDNDINTRWSWLRKSWLKKTKSARNSDAYWFSRSIGSKYEKGSLIGIRMPFVIGYWRGFSKH
jgi:regulator of sigma E protease